MGVCSALCVRAAGVRPGTLHAPSGCLGGPRDTSWSHTSPPGSQWDLGVIRVREDPLGASGAV